MLGDTASLLGRILTELVEMSDRVQLAMQDATESLLNSDVQLAEQVISEDAEIDRINREIETAALELITSHNLSPSEVHFAVAAIRISTSIERMGDLASHVAKQTRLRYPNQAIPTDLKITFTQMGKIANRIIESASSIMAQQDLSRLKEIAAADNEMDYIHRELFSIVLSPLWSHGVEAGIDVTLLSRYYERFADHAASIAKRISILLEIDGFKLPIIGTDGGLT